MSSSQAEVDALICQNLYHLMLDDGFNLRGEKFVFEAYFLHAAFQSFYLRRVAMKCCPLCQFPLQTCQL